MKLIKNYRTLKLAIAMSFITLIMILAYGFMSWKSWENVQSVTKNTNEVESSLFVNLQKDKLSAEKLNEYLVDLKNKRQSCDVVFFISWQRDINARFKKYLEECNKSVEKMNRTIQSIEKIVSFMELDIRKSASSVSNPTKTSPPERMVFNTEIILDTLFPP